MFTFIVLIVTNRIVMLRFVKIVSFIRTRDAVLNRLRLS